MPKVRVTGKIKWFDPAEGFGFIVAADEREYFAHAAEITGDVPRQDDKVEFSRGVGRDGRPKARQIVVLKPGNQP